MNWQPIETAPKDGTSVLLAVPGFEHAQLGYFIDCEDFRYGKSVRARREWALVAGFSMFGSEVKPTHWIKIPEIPANKG